MENEKSIPQKEWHFHLPDVKREYLGKTYTVGVGVLEKEGGLVAVGEVYSVDTAWGTNPSTQICSTVSDAVKYVFSLGKEQK